MNRAAPALLALLALSACAPEEPCEEPDPCPQDTACPQRQDSGPGPSDLDGDGYAADVDCDDQSAQVHPGATESCNGLDDDCDGAVDEGPPADAPTWYPDADGDGYGLEAAGLVACQAPAGTVAAAGDCDDADPRVHPGAAEACDDGLDSDCDGLPGPCGPAAAANLADSPIHLLGSHEDGHAGSAVAAAGDVNADGWPDLLVGAPGEEGEEDAMGAFYLVYGPLEAPGALAAQIRVQGVASNDHAGQVLAAAGDVNADGFDDILAGVAHYDSSGPDMGAVYLLPGPLTASLSLADVSKYVGTDDYALAGAAVAGVGDLQSDGYDDFIAGAPSDSSDDLRCGTVYVLYGPATDYGRISKANAQLAGEAEGDQAGHAVAGAGDVDGDGLPELLVGAPYQDAGGGMAGAVYLLPPDVSGSQALADVGRKLVGAASGDYAGWAVAGAGDVDGDGHADVLIGAYGVDDGGTQAGAAYLVPGAALLAGDDALVLPASGATLLGSAAFDWAGTTVAAGGDADGDGLADILVGAPGRDDGETLETGAVYWLRGPLTGSLSLAEASATMAGSTAYDRVSPACAAGDMDRDGYGDLLLGAPYADEAALDGGVAYLVAGGGM